MKQLQLIKSWCVGTIGLLVVLGLSLNSSTTYAATQNITAVFRPDPGNASKNKFTNTTPPGGYCQEHPTYCQEGVFSIRFPIGFNAAVPLQPLDEIRQGPMFKVPSSPRSVRVVHRETGEVEQVLFQVNGIGGAHEQSQPLYAGAWETGNWVYAPHPCQFGGVGYGNSYIYGFFWRVPTDAGVCFKRPNQLIPDFKYSNMSISYELVTPNPLGMSQGQYEGTLALMVGPGQDFDMGDVMLPDDNALVLHFTLTVEHAFRVDLPPGGNRVELIPEGGWQAWLDRGRAPARLYRDQTFKIATSSRFKMQLECSIDMGNTCGLRNGTGDEVPVQVAVTLPGGIDGQGDQAVRRRPLRLDGSGTELFQPMFFVNRPGTLHFEVLSDDMRGMLNQPGSTYSGVVTVVWDSQV